MTEIKARVPMVEKPDNISDSTGGRAPKYSWRAGMSFDGDYSGDGKPVIRFQVGKNADGNKFAGDLASDPDVDILGVKNL